MLISDQLDFDVPRLGDEFLDEDAIVAEAGGGLGLRALKAFAGLGVGVGNAHALATTTGRSLDHHRIADGARDGDGLFGIGDEAHMPGHGRDAGRGGQLLRRDLVAHCLDGFDRRADEDDVLGLEGSGEGGILGEEAVAGVHSFGAAGLTGGNDLVDREVGIARSGTADMHGLVGEFHMHRVTVGIGIDGDRTDAHALGGSDDATGDLAAIGDEEGGEHSGGGPVGIRGPGTGAGSRLPPPLRGGIKGGGSGYAGYLGQRCGDGQVDAFGIFHDLVVPESQHAVAASDEIIITGPRRWTAPGRWRAFRPSTSITIAGWRQAKSA